MTRGDCMFLPRPCPRTECRHNIEPTGSCALDYAERGPMEHEQIGAVLGVSRQRVQVIEQAALRKLRGRSERLRIFTVPDPYVRHGFT